MVSDRFEKGLQPERRVQYPSQLHGGLLTHCAHGFFLCILLLLCEGSLSDGDELMIETRCIAVAFDRLGPASQLSCTCCRAMVVSACSG